MGKEDIENNNASDLVQQKADDIDTRTDIDRELERVEGIESDADDILDNDVIEESSDDDKGAVSVRRIEDISRPAVDKKREKEAPAKKETPTLATQEEHAPVVDKMRAKIATAAKKKEKRAPVKKGSSKGVLVAVLMTLLSFAAIGVAGWLFLQKLDSDTKITNLEQQVQNREQELAQKSKTAPAKDPVKELVSSVRFAANGAVVDGYRMIPEWSLRYKATEGSEDLSFSVAPMFGGEIMKVRSLSLMRAKPADLSNGAIDSCKTYSEDGTLAIIRRMTKTAYDELMAMPESAENNDIKKNIKKIDDWHFAFILVDERCVGSKQKDQDIWKSGKKEIDSLMKTLETFTQK